VAAGGGLRC